MKSKEIHLKKTSSPFSLTFSFCSVKTPKGKIRTFSITDNEVMMGDRPLPDPGDTIGFTANDNDVMVGEFNKQELKKFLKAVLKDLEK